jgi:ribosome biogenesis GTPase / thiamine phosphate phosphatase
MLIDYLDLAALRGIGLAQPLLNHVCSLNPPRGALLMRVTEVQRESLLLHDGLQEHAARLLPALLHRLQADDDALAVGDWVFAQGNAQRELWAAERVLPLTQLSRRNSYGQRQVLVSNVDTALLVMGLDQDFNLRRLERYVALTRLAGVSALVVLTKADACAEADDRLALVRAQLPAGIEAVAVNGLSASARDALAPWLAPGQTLVLLGSSGAGKSTLTNTLTASEVQPTGGVRHGDERGRHTTTVRSLHRMPQGACIIDTPGLRTLRLDTDEASLGAAFDDIARLSAQCRFRDCRHAGEPGCAVRDGVPTERLKNFHKLLREAKRDTLNAVERKQQVQQWKARGRDAAIRLKARRG